VGGGVGDDEGEGDEHTPVEEPEGDDDEAECEFFEGADEGHEFEFALAGGHAGGDCEVGEDHEGENEEGTGAHCPGEAGSRDHAADDDGEDDAAERGACRAEPHGHPAASEEPGRDTGHAWAEEHAGANRGTDALAEEELVVLCA